MTEKSILIVFILTTMCGFCFLSACHNSEWTLVFDQAVIGLTSHKTDVWAISTHEIFKIDIKSNRREKQTINRLTNPVFRVITCDQSGNIWVGSDQGASRFDGSIWTTFSTKDGLISNNVRAIFVDRDGVVRVGFFEKGAGGYASGKWGKSDRVMDEAGLFPVPSIRVFSQDRKGVFWLGTDEGLVQNVNMQPRLYTTANGLPDNRIISLLVDDQGFIWAGTQNGLSRLDNSWESFSEIDHRLGSSISSLFLDNSNGLWAGTQSGLAYLNDNRWQFYSSQNGFIDSSVFSIAQDSQNSIWVGTDKGLFKLNKSQ